jgi:hypothetical protein
MPRKLSDRVKKAAGTFRADREGPPLAVPEAQAAVAAIAVNLAQAKKAAASRKLTARQKALAVNKVRVLGDDFERALEALAKARAVPVGPVIRPGLELMSEYDCRIAQPPLSLDEQDAFAFIVIDGRNCPCGVVGYAARIVLGKNEGEDWEFCSSCQKPLPWGRRNVASEEKSAREIMDRDNEVRQNALDAQRKKD